jgi:hypothetical protein
MPDASALITSQAPLTRISQLSKMQVAFLKPGKAHAMIPLRVIAIISNTLFSLFGLLLQQNRHSTAVCCGAESSRVLKVLRTRNDCAEFTFPLAEARSTAITDGWFHSPSPRAQPWSSRRGSTMSSTLTALHYPRPFPGEPQQTL